MCLRLTFSAFFDTLSQTEADTAAEHVIDWRLTTDELATRRRQVVLLEHNVEYLRSSLERARCDALFHSGAVDSHRQAMASVRLQVATARSVLADAIAACDREGVGTDVRERIATTLSMLQVDTLGELPVFKPHSTTALFVKRQRSGVTFQYVLTLRSSYFIRSSLLCISQPSQLLRSVSPNSMEKTRLAAVGKITWRRRVICSAWHLQSGYGCHHQPCNINRA
jgi:hypothetical protein